MHTLYRYIVYWPVAVLMSIKSFYRVLTNKTCGYMYVFDFLLTRSLCWLFSGAKVYIGCRDSALGRTAEGTLRAETRNKEVFYIPLKLGSIEEVKKFASALKKSMPDNFIINVTSFLDDVFVYNITSLN